MLAALNHLRRVAGKRASGQVGHEGCP
jgi:hypothetical protein